MCPPLEDAEVLTPGPLNMTLIGNDISAEDQAEMRSSGCTLPQEDGCPCKKEKLEHRHAEGRQREQTWGNDAFYMLKGS